MYGLIVGVINALTGRKRDRYAGKRKQEHFMELLRRGELTASEAVDLLILRAEAGDQQAKNIVGEMARKRS